MSTLDDQISEFKMLLGEDVYQEFVEETLPEFPELAELPLEQALPRLRQIGFISQTYFWRQDLPFDILKQAIIPQYKDQTVRIASVGCSRGHEPYSILLQQWSERDKIELSGYDCNPNSIAFAQQGGPYTIERYRLIEHRSPRTYGGAYYHINGDGIRTAKWSQYVTIKMTEPARQRVSFAVHDISKGPLPQKQDVIFLMHVLCQSNASDHHQWNYTLVACSPAGSGRSQF